MARGRDTIKQRIALDGGKEFKAELEALGQAGARVWRQLQKEAAAFKGPDNTFSARLKQIAKEAEAVGKTFKETGEKVKGVGQTMAKAVTLPIAGAGTGIIKVAADFETAMGSLKVATQASAVEFEYLEKLARDLGKSTSYGPKEVAGAMEELAKIGVSTRDILRGTTAAVVQLAEANGVELAPAAKAAADIMQQFELRTKDLPMIINEISGTINKSKMDFIDYTNAIGQVGGIAGGLGMSLQDMNTVLAATAANFTSGSDAATSFKTFIANLPGLTDKAKDTIDRFGLSFFDAGGNMRSMGKIADELQLRLGHLSKKELQEVLVELFGQDAWRTGLGLMKQGSAGLAQVRGEIEKFDTAAAAAERMKGFNGQMKQLIGSLDELAITIGKAGLLQWATDLVQALSQVVDKLAQSNPELLKWGTIIAGVAATVGPLLALLGFMSIGIGALASAVGTVLTGFAGLGTLFTGLGTALASIGAALGAAAAGIGAWPILLAAALGAAVVVVITKWDAIKQAFADGWAYVASLFDGNLLANAWAGLAAAAQGTWEAIKAGADLAWQGVAAGAQALGQAIAAALSAMGLDAAWTAIQTGAAATWQAVQTGAQAAWQAIASGASFLGSALTTALANVAPAAALVWDGLKFAAVAAFDAIGAAATAAWEVVKSGAIAAWDVLSGNWTSLGDIAAAAWAGIQSTADALWQGIIATFEENQASVKASFDAMVEAINAGWQALIEGARDIALRMTQPFDEAAQRITAAFATVESNIRSSMASAVDAVRDAADDMVDALERVEDQIRATKAAAASAASSASSSASGFATGGYVSGPGTGTSDSILARLSNGEFVMRAAAVRKYGVELLQMLNGLRLPKGGLPGFKTGGLVSIPSLKQGLPAFSTGGLVDGLGAALARMAPGMARLPALAPVAASGGPALQPISLNIGGEQMGTVLAPEPVAANLARFAQGQQIRSAGRKPSWY